MIETLIKDNSSPLISTFARLIEAINATKEIPGPVVLKLPAGQIILSDILYIERSNFVLRGAGSSNIYVMVLNQCFKGTYLTIDRK